MSHNSSTPDIPFPQSMLHSLVQAARALKTDTRGLNPEYDRALVDLICDTAGYANDEGRALVEHLVMDEPREFEIRGRIVIDYAMGFSEAEARQWFPNVLWNDPGRSHAGDIETDHMESAPPEFWHFVRTKRSVVIEGYLTQTAEVEGVLPVRDEVTEVVEL